MVAQLPSATVTSAMDASGGASSSRMTIACWKGASSAAPAGAASVSVNCRSISSTASSASGTAMEASEPDAVPAGNVTVPAAAV